MPRPGRARRLQFSRKLPRAPARAPTRGLQLEIAIPPRTPTWRSIRGLADTAVSLVLIGSVVDGFAASYRRLVLAMLVMACELFDSTGRLSEPSRRLLHAIFLAGLAPNSLRVLAGFAAFCAVFDVDMNRPWGHNCVAGAIAAGWLARVAAEHTRVFSGALMVDEAMRGLRARYKRPFVGAAVSLSLATLLNPSQLRAIGGVIVLVALFGAIPAMQYASSRGGSGEATSAPRPASSSDQAAEMAPWVRMHNKLTEEGGWDGRQDAAPSAEMLRKAWFDYEASKAQSSDSNASGESDEGDRSGSEVTSDAGSSDGDGTDSTERDSEEWDDVGDGDSADSDEEHDHACTCGTDHDQFSDLDVQRQFLMLTMDLCDRCARHMVEAPDEPPLNCDCGGGVPRTRCVCDDAACPYATQALPAIPSMSERMASAMRRMKEQAERRSACAHCGARPRPGQRCVTGWTSVGSDDRKGCCHAAAAQGPGPPSPWDADVKHRLTWRSCDSVCQRGHWKIHRSTCFSKRAPLETATCESVRRRIAEAGLD